MEEKQKRWIGKEEEEEEEKSNLFKELKRNTSMHVIIEINVKSVSVFFVSEQVKKKENEEKKFDARPYNFGY